MVIPKASALKAKAVAEVAARVRTAVVQIETDLGRGSGFIIDSEGFILTNNHVIQDAKTITVFLDDRTSYTATVHGRDLVRDLAVIKIEATDLPTLEIGDASHTPLGTEVIALGYPLGEPDLTVTSGLVSAFKSDTGTNRTWIQTDSVINPGNSGGPLLNLQGEVIGVVSAKIAGAGIEGTGFAVSSNTVKLYLERLMAGEVITN